MKKLSSALFLFVMLSACNSTYKDAETLFNESFELYPNVITSATRSATDEQVPLNHLMEQYEQGNVAEAIPGFDEYLEDNPDYYQLRFYRGLSYLKLDKPEKAIVDLKEVVDKNAELKEQAEWYLALAYIKAQKKNEAIKLLNHMTDNNESQGKKASHLLEHVEKWPS